MYPFFLASASPGSCFTKHGAPQPASLRLQQEPYGTVPAHCPILYLPALVTRAPRYPYPAQSPLARAG